MVKALHPSRPSPFLTYLTFRFWLLIPAAAVIAFTSFRAGGETIPDYQVGDNAQADVVTPTQLVVINAEETAALKEREAQKVQVIFRYNTNVASLIEQRFHNAFSDTRSNFLHAVEEFYGHAKLEADEAATPKFNRLAISFQRQFKSFPVTTNIAQLWAQGESDQAIESALAARLRESMSQYVRIFALPKGMKLTQNVRMVPIGDWSETITLEDAEKRGKGVPRASLVVVGQVRNDLLELFPGEDQPVGKFLCSLIRTNCAMDVELTQQARAKRVEPLWAADRYEPGQKIISRGEVVDAKVKAALDQLREKTAVGNLEQLIVDDRAKTQRMQSRNRWLAAGGATLVLVFGITIWRVARRRSAGSLLPARVVSEQTGAIVVECPSCEETIVVPQVSSGVSLPPPNAHPWLLPHLLRILKDKLVTKLLSQRSDLLDTQEKAAADVAELEARLAKIHAPLQERLRAYEQRISDLERELAQKGEENRELIRAKIQLTKEHMEAAKEWVELN